MPNTLVDVVDGGWVKPSGESGSEVKFRLCVVVRARVRKRSTRAMLVCVSASGSAVLAGYIDDSEVK